MNFSNVNEFYPTPRELFDKAVSGINWHMINTILEPSAGKGSMIDYVLECTDDRDKDIDCIEIDPELRSVITGKGYRVVSDDFLKFMTFKNYDLILMNPPFSKGAEHLLKAIEMQRNGGNIICILNAETIRNPFTNERKVLVQKLHDLNADISFYEDEFSHAERATHVEVAVVRITIEKKKKESQFFSEVKMKKKSYESSEAEQAAVAHSDFIEFIIEQYNYEVEAGIKLIREYEAMQPLIMDSFKDQYAHPCISLKIGSNETLDVNEYVKLIRNKYWSKLFRDPRFVGKMTSAQQEEYLSELKKLENYDFSYFNIKELQMRMNQTLISGIEDCIIQLFDELSHTYSWEPGSSNNIHYYNGWRTNKSWIINKKVILPISAYNYIWKEMKISSYEVKRKLADIEKALSYLAGGLSNGISLERTLAQAERDGVTKRIEFNYFFATFYKKGTCHIEFKDMELLKKLNIFGSQQKRWLPPSYGKKKYSEMSPEERQTVDAFEGEVSYNQTMANPDYYIYNPDSVLRLDQVS